MAGIRMRAVACAGLLVAFASCDVATDRARQGVVSDISASALSVIEDTIAACGACDGVATKVLTLKAPLESAILFELPDVERAANGTYYLGTRDGAIHAYDTRGRRLRQLGRRGRGPGEIDRLVTFSVGADDSVFAVSSDRRLLVFGPDQKFARGTTLAHGVSTMSNVAPSIQTLPSGRVVMSAFVRTPALDGLPVFLMDTSGKLAQAFGSLSIALPRSFTTRVLTREAHTGALWVADPAWYRFERYEAQGDSFAREPSRVLGVRSPWVFGGNRPLMTAAEGHELFENAKQVIIKSDVRARPRVLEREPTTTMRSLRIAGDTMWVAWQVPAPNWNKVELTYPLANEMMISSDLNDSLWNTVVEVLDVRTNRVLLRKHFPFHAQLAAPGTLAHPYFDEVGNVLIDIWAIRP